MYSLSIAAAKRFERFANAVDTDWVTIILADAGSLFVEDSNETFAVLQLKSIRSESETNHLFRVQKELLKVLLIDGQLEIDVQDSEVQFTMRGAGGCVRTLTTEKHQAFTTAFREKFDVIKSASGKVFRADDLKPMLNVAKAMYSFVEVEDGVAGVMSRSGTLVFREVPDIPNLCLSAQAASSLFACSATWYLCKNFVYTLEDSFGLLVSQSRGSGLDTYQALKTEDTGAAVKVHVDFSNLLSILLKTKGSTIEYNFRTGECKSGETGCIYGAIVNQADLQVSEKYSKSSVVLNPKVFTNIIAKLNVMEWDFKVKKHFIQLEADNYTIVCK